MAQLDSAPTRKVVGAPDAKASHERREKPEKAAALVCAKYPRRFYNLIFYVPVVELDTIKASDAFGPGSSPGGHTIKKPLAGFS